VNDDIVTRLRDFAARICSVRGDTNLDNKAVLARAAADEIDRLRADLCNSRGDAILAAHLLWDARCDICYEIAQAKTNLPQGHADTVVEAKAEADRRGWDCFKDGGK
jgi:hypothetical protein